MGLGVQDSSLEFGSWFTFRFCTASSSLVSMIATNNIVASMTLVLIYKARLLTVVIVMAVCVLSVTLGGKIPVPSLHVLRRKYSLNPCRTLS